MERVIQDSDDERDDEGLEPYPAEVPHTTDAFRNAGTGSTESLKKAFQAAHDAQFHTQPDDSKANVEPAETVHILTSPSKQCPLRRLKTTPNASLAHRTQENLTANGRSKSVCNSSAVEPIQGEHEWAHHGGSTNNVWGLEGTIRDNYTYHEPMALFPEPLSTVMNTTLTQERLLEEALAPGFLGLEQQPDPQDMETPYEPNKSSIPWSDFLKTPSEDAPSDPDQERWPGQAASQSRLVSQKVLPDGCASGTPGHAADSPQATVPPPRSHEVSSDSLEGQTMDEPVNQLHSQNAPSSEPHHPGLSRKKRTRTPHPATDDELEAIGLPQEQYKPRPSRSRSSKASLLEPTDYSVRPEAVSRKRARRSKTTGALNETGSLATPEKIHQICEMGFTPQSTQVALEQNGGDVRQSIDWLVARSGDVDELALADPPKVKRRRNNEVRDGEHVEETVGTAAGNNRSQTTREPGNPERSVQAAITTGADHLLRPGVTPTSVVALSVSKSPTKVEVVIPRTVKPTPANELNGSVAAEANPSGELNSSSRPEQRKPSTDLPRPDQNEQHQKVSEPAKEQKRGRGRPRKTAIATTTTTTAAVEHTPDKENIHDEPPPIAAEEKPSKQVAPPVTIKDCVPGPLPEVNEAPVLPAKTPEKQTKPANSAHSPASKGKVAYRVGLSKRARIAPLLRIVKK